MVTILYDMYIVSSAKGVGRGKFDKANINPEQYILKKHNIDSLQFVKGNDYYAHDIEVYKSIVEAVKEKLTVEKERYSKLEKEEQKEKRRYRDSLIRLKEISIKGENIPSKNRIRNPG